MRHRHYMHTQMEINQLIHIPKSKYWHLKCRLSATRKIQGYFSSGKISIEFLSILLDPNTMCNENKRVKKDCHVNFIEERTL